jgi:DeoR/GlpR family transcriptional regulator of sugar metabolism
MAALLKRERQQLILEHLARTGRVVATELQERLGVSTYTIRRDLDELADTGRLMRVHGGALARSPTPRTYEQRLRLQPAGKAAVGRAAAALVKPGQTVILDGGSTVLAVVEALPADFAGTVLTHSPPVAVALGRCANVEVVVVGGVLDRRAMVALGAQTAARYRGVFADVCLLGLWSLHPEHGITQEYAEEAELRRVLLGRADRVIGLATHDKLATVAPFTVGPADALSHLVTDADATDDALAPYSALGISVVRAPVADR